MPNSTAQEKFYQLLQRHLLEPDCLATLTPQTENALIYAIKQSDFLYSCLQKQGDFFRQILQQPIQFADCQHYLTRLQNQLDNLTDENQLYQQLRLFRHRELAKLSYCQSLNLASVEQIFIRLSELAEACIIACRDWLYQQLCQQFGTPTNAQGIAQPLLILGMGKLGGKELNFSSDIDLIFTYPETGETQGARRSIDNQKFFTKLGQRLINALDQRTPDGFVYRTDMRLRPFGDSGALVLSFNAMETYYQEQGRDWERYAMIKARILGEDANCPYQPQLRQLLRPFIYRRYIDFSAIQALRDMKSKIEREIRRRGLTDNIKLGAGGIREIEFIAQVFQLIRGGREVSLQQQSILAILPLLSKLGLLSQEESQQLQQAYLFLRHVENVLQAINDQQTQTLPSNPQDQQRLVRACAKFKQGNEPQGIIEQQYPIADWQSFYQVLQQHQQKVRSVFDQLIGNEPQQPVPDNLAPWQDMFEEELDPQQFIQLLPADEPQQDEDIQPLLNRLHQFKQESERRPMGNRGREVLNQLMPKLLQQIFSHKNYRTLLPRILTIIEKTLTRTTYLELLLENPAALHRLLQLCAKSQLIAEQVARHPILLDELLDQKALLNLPTFEQYPAELQQYLLRLPQDDEEQFIDALRQFKNAALFHVACADILAILPVMKVSDHLTFLAEAIIEAVVNLAWQQLSQRYGVPDHLVDNQRQFLVIGYGKLGGIELGYKSDLDLVFLYNAPADGQTVGGKKSIDSSQFYLRLAKKIISIFNINTSAGVLYEVDMRLRPSGESGLLVSTINAFEHYQRHEAWTWENQALVRSRAVYGDAELRQRFEQIRTAVLAMPRDQSKLKQDVREMREKMYQHLASKDQSQFNLKKDQGGITDIEFIAQYLVLAHSPQNPSLAQWSDNVRIFDIMAQYQVIIPDCAEKLKECYTSLRNQIHHLNLLGLPSIVSADQFVWQRDFIQQLWQQLFNE
ncbi:bifunctional glutamine synthetase adenylyltransferase/deadenyltransferase [Volucribacter amazonae]|uniref:Bifunctional glutamine synthetase adenylyltransferase/adenylyl-removing enzyme n=2 Tax=Volucribacter amazonae TaxID=256731 RepID=A0A9X4PDK5_9PAST|nr:bifunctional glutamine synthetase adenylyltransferase/deadenyltransferase [Volucribacter amazonae]